ncbi:unnamed protein product [Cladocopium goreaui]|uniref:Fascin n=1 Tax=Cladocopium goreaui TaxID=2562237 RepID=A0A9P1CZZ1_9DINO|nr:unnamed protein product [Cladocopium goreaui]
MSRSQVSFLEDPVFHHRNNGDLRASSAVVKDAEKFDLTHHEDGRISLKCHTGKYLKVDKNGDVRGSGSSVEEESKFEVESHESGLISLRSSGGYVAAEANGRIRANRATVGAWEVFQAQRLPPGFQNFDRKWGFKRLVPIVP